MIGLLAILVGVGCGVVGFALLRRNGSGWRIGRLLSAAPQHELADAIGMAERSEPTYVRLHGRIDSDEEFPSDEDMPLVFRRRRLQRGDASRRGSWRTFDEERLAVPFWLSERDQRVDIDTAALGDGLVVVPRLSTGVAADLTAEPTVDAPPEMPDDTPVRLRIEQVSSIDHATAAGVPRLTPEGSVVLGPGLGRPLILTTLDPDEAMRVLAAEHRTSLIIASGLLVAAPIVVVAGLVLTLTAP